MPLLFLNGCQANSRTLESRKIFEFLLPHPKCAFKKYEWKFISLNRNKNCKTFFVENFLLGTIKGRKIDEPFNSIWHAPWDQKLSFCPFCSSKNIRACGQRFTHTCPSSTFQMVNFLAHIRKTLKVKCVTGGHVWRRKNSSFDLAGDLFPNKKMWWTCDKRYW